MTAKALRALRLALGLTLTDFADLLQITATDVYAWERGVRPIDDAKLSVGLERILSADGSWPADDDQVSEAPEIAPAFDPRTRALATTSER